MATDFISRGAAVEKITALINESGKYTAYESGADDACYIVEHDIAAADVVEVVRCKDCRYFHNGYDEKCCINHKGVVATNENGFCHHAERRADDG